MKLINIMHNVGRVKYLVIFHKEGKKHTDGSDFHDIAIFKDKKKMNEFLKQLN